MIWLILLAAFLGWLVLSTLIALILGRVLRLNEEDPRPGYITDWST